MTNNKIDTYICIHRPGKIPKSMPFNNVQIRRPPAMIRHKSATNYKKYSNCKFSRWINVKLLIYNYDRQLNHEQESISR